MEREQSYPAPGWSLGDISAAIKRKWVTALVLFLVTTAAAGALGALWPKSYESTAAIAVSPLAGNPTRDIEVNIDTEAVVVTSRRVITTAAGHLGISAKDLQERTTVAIPTDSNALEVTVTSSSPGTAAAQANAVANAYLAYRAQQSNALIQKYVKKGLDSQIDSLLNSLASSTTSGDRSMVQRRVQALREKRSQIIASMPGPGEVISRATPPSSPSSPGLPIFLAAGVVLGLLVGGAAALVHDRLDPRVRSARLLGRHVPCRVLDSGGRGASRFWEHAVFGLKAIRRETGARIDAPTVLVSTESALDSDFVKELRGVGSSEATGPVVVVPRSDTVGVAQGVATNPTDSLFVLVCRSSDRFPAVTELVDSLEEWNREPSLILMLEAASKSEADKTKPAEAKAPKVTAKDQKAQQVFAPTKTTGAANGSGTGNVATNGNGVGNGNGERPQAAGKPFRQP